MANDSAQLESQGEIRSVIQQVVATRFGHPVNAVRCGALQYNNFSACFELSFGPEADYYVKIPKAGTHQRLTSLLPLTDADRWLARAELESLTALAAVWPAESGDVRPVAVADFVSEHNALITRRVRGRDLFVVLRSEARRQRIFASRTASKAAFWLRRFGGALRRLHDSDSRQVVSGPDDICARVERYAADLGSVAPQARIKRAVDYSRRLTTPTLEVDTFKGLDLRNLILSDSGWLYVLDPGKKKRDLREADLARFLVTCRLIFWGSPELILGWTITDEDERAFLDGYGLTDSPLLRLLILKELLKHWCVAHDVVRRKRWPRMLANFMRRRYVDRFYRNQVNTICAQIAEA